MIDHSLILNLVALGQNAVPHSHNLTVPAHGSSIASLGQEITDSLFPNVPTFLGHIIATIILLTVIYRFGYKPFRQSQRNKHDYIAGQIDSAIDKNGTATKLQQEAQDLLKETHEKANNLLSDTYVTLKSEQEKMLDHAKDQQQVLLNDTKNKIIRQQELFEHNAKNKIADLSLTLAEKIVRKKLKTATEKDMIDEFLKDVDLDVHTHE